MVCEGPDDLAAMRALVPAIEPDATSPKSSKYEGGLTFDTSKVRIVLQAASGAKSDLARNVMDLAEGTAGTRPELIGVVFDPDRDSQDKEFEFFKRDYNKLSSRQKRGSKLKPKGKEHVVRINNRDVRIILAAWRLSTPTPFDNLPDEQTLERVMIEGILGSKLANAALNEWALDSTVTLRSIVSDHGWKRAFRIWNAALQPKSESFIEKLLQDVETREACLESLKSTPVAALIRSLLQVES
jgi:hypothetical protein